MQTLVNKYNAYGDFAPNNPGNLCLLQGRHPDRAACCGADRPALLRTKARCSKKSRISQCARFS
jgi:hypothetical protein